MVKSYVPLLRNIDPHCFLSNITVCEILSSFISNFFATEKNIFQNKKGNRKLFLVNSMNKLCKFYSSNIVYVLK